MNEVPKPCAFRDRSILTDEILAEKYMSELPQNLEPDSSKEEAIEVQAVCDRSSCLLNLGMILRYIVNSTYLEPREDIGWAVPPDCSWHDKQT